MGAHKFSHGELLVCGLCGRRGEEGYREGEGWCWWCWCVAFSRFAADETKTGLRSSTGSVAFPAERSTGLLHDCTVMRLPREVQSLERLFLASAQYAAEVDAARDALNVERGRPMRAIQRGIETRRAVEGRAADHCRVRGEDILLTKYFAEGGRDETEGQTITRCT